MTLSYSYRISASAEFSSDVSSDTLKLEFSFILGKDFACFVRPCPVGRLSSELSPIDELSLFGKGGYLNPTSVFLSSFSQALVQIPLILRRVFFAFETPGLWFEDASGLNLSQYVLKRSVSCSSSFEFSYITCNAALSWSSSESWESGWLKPSIDPWKLLPRLLILWSWFDFSMKDLRLLSFG